MSLIKTFGAVVLFATLAVGSEAQAQICKSCQSARSVVVTRRIESTRHYVLLPRVRARVAAYEIAPLRPVRRVIWRLF